MLRSVAFSFAGLLLAGTAAAQDDCQFETQRSATITAANARSLRVEVGAGSLRVQGVPGLAEVRVRGRACASSQALLEQLNVVADRSGDVVRVTTPEVDHDFRNEQYARLDLVIEVPAGVEAEISDGSGSAEIRGLGATRVRDGSGDLLIEEMSGVTEIEDGSGEIVAGVIDGDLIVSDGSGEIRLDDVRGSVSIEDGSGSIRLTRVGRNARIDDSSGDIVVDGVGGDLIVGNDSSGSIRHAEVRGRIDVPRRRR